MSDVEATLAERAQRYGSFIGHACITQDLKLTMAKSPKWRSLDPDQKEALEMIVHKIGRILNGDPDYADSWHDIAGYAKLVEDRLTISQSRKIGPEVPHKSDRVRVATVNAAHGLTDAVKRAARKR